MELIILAVPLLLLWLMVSRGRKQQRQLASLQDSVLPGSKIMTTSGLYAEVVELEDDAVVLEIAPGVHTRWSRRAIGQVLSAGDPTAAAADDSIDITEATGADRDDVRSEAGYAAPPNHDVTDGGTGTDGR